jgi:hypothetical protein
LEPGRGAQAAHDLDRVIAVDWEDWLVLSTFAMISIVAGALLAATGH